MLQAIKALTQPTRKETPFGRAPKVAVLFGELMTSSHQFDGKYSDVLFLNWKVLKYLIHLADPKVADPNLGQCTCNSLSSSTAVYMNLRGFFSTKLKRNKPCGFSSWSGYINTILTTWKGNKNSRGFPLLNCNRYPKSSNQHDTCKLHALYFPSFTQALRWNFPELRHLLYVRCTVVLPR